MSRTGLTCDWGDAFVRNGIIEAHSFSVVDVRSGLDVFEGGELDGATTSATATQVENSVSYDVRVTAVNRAGSATTPAVIVQVDLNDAQASASSSSTNATASMAYILPLLLMVLIVLVLMYRRRVQAAVPLSTYDHTAPATASGEFWRQEELGVEVVPRAPNPVPPQQGRARLLYVKQDKLDVRARDSDVYQDGGSARSYDFAAMHGLGDRSPAAADSDAGAHGVQMLSHKSILGDLFPEHEPIKYSRDGTAMQLPRIGESHVDGIALDMLGGGNDADVAQALDVGDRTSIAGDRTDSLSMISYQSYEEDTHL